MSDIHIDTPDDGQIDMKAYREAMDQRAAATRQADMLTRENAMLRAGIPTGTKVGQAFVRDYDGPLDDSETIRSQAIEWGLYKPEGSKADPKEGGTPADQAQVEADRAALQHGGLPPDVSASPPPKDAVKEGYDAFTARLAAGATREQASAEMTSRLIDRAVKGDESALVHKWTSEELGYSS